MLQMDVPKCYKSRIIYVIFSVTFSASLFDTAREARRTSP